MRYQDRVRSAEESLGVATGLAKQEERARVGTGRLQRATPGWHVCEEGGRKKDRFQRASDCCVGFRMSHPA